MRSKFFNLVMRWRRAIAVVGVGLILAAGVYAYVDFRGFQDRALREALEAAATPLDFATLRAQQWTAEYAYGALILGGFGLLASVGSVAALVYTFREQRRLTINQSRAYLELIEAHYTAARWGSIDEGEDKNDQIDLTFTLHNSGETPAINVYADIVLDCSPEHDGFDTPSEASYTITGISGYLPEIPAKGTYLLRATGKGILPHRKTESQSWRYRSPEVRALGKIVFSDAFSSDRREIRVSLETTDIPESWNNPPIEFYGWHRARKGTDRMLSHQRERLKREEAERNAKKNKLIP